MVDVAQRSPQQIHTWAERILPSLIRAWEELPAAVAEIDTWDQVEAIDYVEEWGVLEDQRADLERLARLGLLTDKKHQTQLSRLRELVDQHQGLLRQLRRSD